jgi:phage gpG-like protein
MESIPMSIHQRIIDHGYAERINQIAAMDHLFTKVGLPENGEVGEQKKRRVVVRKGKQRFGSYTAVRGSRHEAAENMSEIIRIAAVHEFGAPKRNIPERPFIRTSFDDNFPALQEFKKTQAMLVIQGKQTAMTGIKKIGEWLTNKTKAKINSNIPPELDPKTIKRKHSSRTLIDTAQLLNSIQHTEEYVK